ncbi:MAG: metalloregulator ArsR/SmtB family transcription factor [Defluviitaleaceae bacterium]|nr:metalloregulator ArsR/SmtB family transcription factor [Defluviitaleaceae bacterium]
MDNIEYINIKNKNEEKKLCCVDPEKVDKIKKQMLADEVVYDVADFFKVFGDSTRLKILFALKEGELCVGDLSEVLNMNQSAVSHQLRLLRKHNLVKFRRSGKTVFYTLDDKHVETLLEQGFEHLLHKNVY